VRRIKTPHKHTPYFLDLARSPKMIAILQKLLRTESVRLHGSKINMKSPAGGAPVEWHQDWAFYPHTNDDILAIGVMLDDVALENGPMLVMPGSHKGPTFDHHAEGRFCGAMDPTASPFDFSKAVACTGRAGSVRVCRPGPDHIEPHRAYCASMRAATTDLLLVWASVRAGRAAAGTRGASSSRSVAKRVTLTMITVVARGSP